MIQKLLLVLISGFLCTSLIGCVTAIDSHLPYPQLPEILIAREVQLWASPNHPDSILPLAAIPAGAKVSLIGKDKSGGNLLVSYNNMLGWMSIFWAHPSSGAGNLNTAITIDPLEKKCTKYLGALFDPQDTWTSDENRTVIVQGSILRSTMEKEFKSATLTLTIEGSGKIAHSDYVHTQLTPSSAIILFAFSVTDIQKGSRLKFLLNNPTSEVPSFEVAFFNDDCPRPAGDLPYSESLPIGELKNIAQQPPPANTLIPPITPTVRPTTTPIPNGTPIQPQPMPPIHSAVNEIFSFTNLNLFIETIFYQPDSTSAEIGTPVSISIKARSAQNLNQGFITLSLPNELCPEFSIQSNSKVYLPGTKMLLNEKDGKGNYKFIFITDPVAEAAFSQWRAGEWRELNVTVTPCPYLHQMRVRFRVSADVERNGIWQAENLPTLGIGDTVDQQGFDSYERVINIMDAALAPPHSQREGCYSYDANQTYWEVGAITPLGDKCLLGNVWEKDGRTTAGAIVTPIVNSTPNPLPPPEQFIQGYYTELNSGNYAFTWSLLSPRFQHEKNNDDFAGYAAFWRSSTARVDIVKMNTQDIDRQRPILNAILQVYQTDHCVRTEEHIFSLIPDVTARNWLIDAQNILSSGLQCPTTSRLMSTATNTPTSPSDEQGAAQNVENDDQLALPTPPKSPEPSSIELNSAITMTEEFYAALNHSEYEKAYRFLSETWKVENGINLNSFKQRYAGQSHFQLTESSDLFSYRAKHARFTAKLSWQENGTTKAENMQFCVKYEGKGWKLNGVMSPSNDDCE